MDEVYLLFPGRTPLAIRSKASRIGSWLPNHERWTKDEISNLKRCIYEGLGGADVAIMFPGRTAKAVLAKMVILRARDGRHFDKRRWLPRELRYMITLLREGHHGRDLHIAFSNRDPSAINAIAHRLRVKYGISSRQASRQSLGDRYNGFRAHGGCSIRTNRPDAGAGHADGGVAPKGHVVADGARFDRAA